MKTIRSSLINPMLALLLVFQSCTIYQKQEIGLPEDPNPKDRYKIYTEHGKVYRGVKLLKKQDTIHGIHYRLKTKFFSLPADQIEKAYLWRKRPSKVATALTLLTGAGLLAFGIWYAIWAANFQSRYNRI